jgi:hypothetical protein
MIEVGVFAKIEGGYITENLKKNSNKYFSFIPELKRRKLDNVSKVCSILA